MGFLTTFTIYNDGLCNVRENREQFVQQLLDGMDEAHRHRLPVDKCVGNHANLLKVHLSRHADDHTCYVHMGNTVCEMNPWSRETKDLLERFPEFFERMLQHMERDAKALRKMLKENKNSDIE